jgi:hypothetical protein
MISSGYFAIADPSAGTTPISSSFSAERNKVRAVHNKAQRLPARRKVMQSWADYLDGLRRNANVVPLRRLVG